MTEPNIHESAKVLQTKVDLLSWIGMIPDMQAMMYQMQTRDLRQELLREDLPGDDLNRIKDTIAEGHSVMTDGLNIVLKKLTTDECVECGKCDDLKDAVVMLLDEESDIDEVNAFIKDKFGDIEHSDETGLPGHRRPKSNPLEAILGGRGLAGALTKGGLGDLLDLIGQIKSAGGNVEVITHPDDLEAGEAKRIADNFIHSEKPDKDKLH